MHGSMSEGSRYSNVLCRLSISLVPLFGSQCNDTICLYHTVYLYTSRCGTQYSSHQSISKSSRHNREPHLAPSPKLLIMYFSRSNFGSLGSDITTPRPMLAAHSSIYMVRWSLQIMGDCSAHEYPGSSTKWRLLGFP